jgi:exopolysaccharide biosynthesis polyprenyl glycosylphosphotransferase
MTPLKVALAISDFATALVLLLLVVNLRFDVLGGAWSVLEMRPVPMGIVYGLLWVGSLWLTGLYRLRAHWTLRGEAFDVLRATVVLLLAALTLMYAFDLHDISRVFVAMLLVAQPTLTIASRTVLRRLLEGMRSDGKIRRQILIIGAGPEARDFALTVERHRALGLQVIGHLRSKRERKPAVSNVLGEIDDLEAILRTTVVDEVGICLAPSDWKYVEPVTRICEEEGKIVRVSIAAFGGLLSGGRYEEVAGLPIVTFLYGPDRFLGMLGKRTFDIVVSSVLLVLLSPVMLGIALYMRVADRGPVLFKQSRVGLHGRLFSCVKFRTMVPDAEERFADLEHLSEVNGPAFKLTDDPRITRTGRWLRRTSLDELPQLWNVFRGEMSIVGPRPAPPREVDKYSIWHRRRLSMRPGVTGLWQVSARSASEFDQRVELDLDYIDRWSIWMDVKIMLRTIPAMLALSGR